MSDSRATHYTLRHRLTAAISQGLFRNFEYTVRHGLLKGMRRKGGLGWLPEWFPGAGKRTAEQAFWEEFDLRGKVVWDVGAFEGLLTLHFARSAAQVVAWEPNPRTKERLEDNLALNGVRNVLIRPVGVGKQPGIITLVEDPMMPGGASGSPTIAAQTSRALRNARLTPIEIVTLDADRREHQLPCPDLIKIDIEGMELPALEGALSIISEHNPSLFIEMHGSTEDEKFANAARVLALLNTLGYLHILHVESGVWVGSDPAGAVRAMRGHLYCTT